MEQQFITLTLIFFARILDVSIGTFRIILIGQGYRKIAPVLGFFEILIWLTAIGKAINNLNSIYSYLVYAGGFAAGNYIGMLLESKISLGFQSIRIITSEKITALPMALKDEGWEISMVDGKGPKGPIMILYTVVKKRTVKKLIEITNTIEPNAFITIEDVRQQNTGFMLRKAFKVKFEKYITNKR